MGQDLKHTLTVKEATQLFFIRYSHSALWRLKTEKQEKITSHLTFRYSMFLTSIGYTQEEIDAQLPTSFNGLIDQIDEKLNAFKGLH